MSSEPHAPERSSAPSSSTGEVGQVFASSVALGVANIEIRIGHWSSGPRHLGRVGVYRADGLSSVGGGLIWPSRVPSSKLSWRWFLRARRVAAVFIGKIENDTQGPISRCSMTAQPGTSAAPQAHGRMGLTTTQRATFDVAAGEALGLGVRRSSPASMRFEPGPRRLSARRPNGTAGYIARPPCPLLRDVPSGTALMARSERGFPSILYLEIPIGHPTA
jgi:hypothetical protein